MYPPLYIHAARWINVCSCCGTYAVRCVCVSHDVWQLYIKAAKRCIVACIGTVVLFETSGDFGSFGGNITATLHPDFLFAK